ncbi:TonB-dependent receptor [Chitinophaga pendula]|uniref:TonB-dependent receptor n=1 Tax=Chitinophaga TaxID=79328 RepID=UPI000BAEFE8A|nr:MULTISPECIES: TonB-dependent receptor [Chitinophaga]ASZ09679.1 TonB-dependent siderophore receptor [Chitinophaga sp. MD30]UCJ07381.1 TonB-dependent receptor [Chitinophaga pendula]
MRVTFTILLLLITATLFAQQSTIKGIIHDAEGQPIPSATITIAGQKKGVLAGGDGQFEITGLANGEYVIQASMVGFEPARQKVRVSGTTTVKFLLASAVKELQHIEITGRKEKGYKNTASFIATKTATALKDVPQAVSYVTKEVMQDQGANRMGDVVKNMSGVNQFTFYDDLTIRGFRINGGNTTQLVNGMRTFSGFWKQPAVNYLERVEVIKGPASALFGNASPGGTINRVTKKPLEEARRSVSVSAGSFDTYRFLTDLTGPVNKKKNLLYRLNVGYENSRSFRDVQFDKNLIIAPSISYLPGKKTRINLDVVYNSSDSRLDRGQSTDSINIHATPISTALNTKNDYLKEKTYTILTSVNHQFTSRLALNVGYMRTGYSQSLQEHRSANAYAKDAKGVAIPNLVERQVFIRETKQHLDNITAYLTYDFKTGRAAHKLLGGADYILSILPPGSFQNTASGYLLKAGGSKAYDPKKAADYVFYDYFDGKQTISIPKPNVPSFDLLHPNNDALDVAKYTFGAATNSATKPVYSALSGFYLQDQIKLGAFQLLAGIRYETYLDKTNYKTDKEMNVRQYKLLPRVGLVFTAAPNINIYGTYTQGYNPQDPTVQSNPLSGGPFSPVESDLIEGGLKTEWLGGRLTANLSVYRIRQKNALYDPGVAGQPDLRITGNEEAKGVELDLVGQIQPNWNVIVTYAFNDAKILSAGKLEQALLDRQKPNAPRHQGSFWTKYTLPQGPLKGLGFGIGGNFVTERFVSISQVQKLPAYQILNAGIYYRINKVSFQVNLNNLTNQVYWVGGYDYLRLFPGTPRNWLATATYTF